MSRFALRWLRCRLIAALLAPAGAALATGTWRVIPTPNPSGGGQDVLNAVAIVSPTDVWAVGTGLGDVESLTEHWNGTAWSIVPSPSLPTVTDINGVAAVASNDVWAVGDQMGGGLGMTMHWNGSTWTSVTNPVTNYVALNAGPGGPGGAKLSPLSKECKVCVASAVYGVGCRHLTNSNRSHTKL